MKLSDYAKQNGLSYRTALRHFKAGKINNARQLDNGTILVDSLHDIVIITGDSKFIEEIINYCQSHYKTDYVKTKCLNVVSQMKK